MAKVAGQGCVYSQGDTLKLLMLKWGGDNSREEHLHEGAKFEDLR